MRLMIRSFCQFSLHRLGGVGLVGAVALGVLSSANPAASQVVLSRDDTTGTDSPTGASIRELPVSSEPGRFDGGRMWTFERPPVAWFQEEYGLAADTAWFRQARLGALRIPNCSASLVSPEGLVLTNHHCARRFVTQVSQPGEELIRNGFYAETAEQEREVQGFTAEQLIHIRDISRDVSDAIGNRTGPERLERMNDKIADLTEDLLDDWGDDDDEDAISVEIVSFYGGARHSAYVFRNYSNARLVMAPEEQIGFFGGDADNFNFPRYNLDVALFRLVNEDGDPLETPNYYRWSVLGVSDGDPVFVVGNPGSTHRTQTMAQLMFRRAVEDQKTLEFLVRRAAVLEEFMEAFPAESATWDTRNEWFGAVNAIKSTTGAIAGLHNEGILARKDRVEAELAATIAADPQLQATYGGLLSRLADLQDQKRELGSGYGAFLGLTASGFESPTLHRAFLAFQVLNARQAGAPAPVLEPLLAQIDSIRSVPEILDGLLIQARVEEFLEYFDPDQDRWLGSILRGRTAEGVAAVLQRSGLADSLATAEGLRTGRLDSNDPAIRFVSFYAPEYSRFQGGLAGLTRQEEEAESRLGMVRIQLGGLDTPPDATFSPRISDGRVTGLNSGDAQIDAFTTLGGMFDRYRELGGSAGPASAWNLPARWLEAESSLDLATPFNFASTLDIVGGNSGSPVLNANLEIVGVVFDGNLPSLTGDYIFLPESNRAITVDARAILHVLQQVYGADRIVDEILRSAVVTTPADGPFRN